MKKVTLEIPENQLDFFMEVFRRLGLSINSKTDEIPEWQKKTTLNRLKELKEDPSQAIDFDEMINRLEDKHGL